MRKVYIYVSNLHMIRIKIGQTSAKEFQKEDIDVFQKDMDIQHLGNDVYSVIHNHRSHEISISNIDHASKTISLTVDGIATMVQYADKLDLLLEKMGIDHSSSQKLTVLKSPMPGLVLEWFVQEGDHVQAGDKLLILEAMKMENVIKSPGEGIIQKIDVSKGVAVEKNQVLIHFK